MLSDFEKEKVFWTKKMNLSLVIFMKSKPYIWNKKHPNYTSIKLRDHAYAQFASKYGDNFSGLAVKERWTNIRSTFASYVRKSTRKSNSGESYKVNWHLWDACQFLRQKNKNLAQDGQLDIDSPNQERLRPDPNSDSDDVDIKDTSIPEEDSGTEYQSDNDVATNHTKTNCKSLAKDIASILHGFQSNAFGLDTTRNGKIGTMVAKRLSKMPPSDAANVSVKIMEILRRYQVQSTNGVGCSNSFASSKGS